MSSDVYNISLFIISIREHATSKRIGDMRVDRESLNTSTGHNKMLYFHTHYLIHGEMSHVQYLSHSQYDMNQILIFLVVIPHDVILFYLLSIIFFLSDV